MLVTSSELLAAGTTAEWTRIDLGVRSQADTAGLRYLPALPRRLPHRASTARACADELAELPVAGAQVGRVSPQKLVEQSRRPFRSRVAQWIVPGERELAASNARELFAFSATVKDSLLRPSQYERSIGDHLLQARAPAVSLSHGTLAKGSGDEPCLHGSIELATQLRRDAGETSPRKRELRASVVTAQMTWTKQRGRLPDCRPRLYARNSPRRARGGARGGRGVRGMPRAIHRASRSNRVPHSPKAWLIAAGQVHLHD